MKAVLVDTSVWVDHFRHNNSALVNLLGLDLVLTHPLVIGEIACGTPPNRIQTLADLFKLQQTQQASVSEVMDFIQGKQLFGLGCGLVDLMLLSSALITPGVELWTLDKRLDTLAERLSIRHSPVLH